MITPYVAPWDEPVQHPSWEYCDRIERGIAEDLRQQQRYDVTVAALRKAGLL